MKITIELTDAQVSGIKEYLKDLEGDKHFKVGKKEIQQHIAGEVSGVLQVGAVYDYIRAWEEKVSYNLG